MLSKHLAGVGPAIDDVHLYRALLLNLQSTRLLNLVLVLRLHCTAFAAGVKALPAMQKSDVLQLQCAMQRSESCQRAMHGHHHEVECNTYHAAV